MTQFSPEYEAWGWTPVTQDDLQSLKEQLGREPRSVIAVAARCRCGKPQVIVNRPLSPDESGRWTIFPTLFWLTSPYLVREVSVLEAAGWIGRLRRQLKDSKIARAMHASHAATAQLRLRLVTPEEVEALREASPGQYQVLVESGVAGMRAFDGVKCLHAHLADYLGRSKANPDAVNPIGRAVAELLLSRGVDLKGDCLPASGRVAAIDVGSNSVRLFVGEWQAADKAQGPRPRLEPVHCDLEMTRLAAGVTRKVEEDAETGGRLPEAAVEKTLAALARFSEQAAELGAAAPVGGATAAVRDAADGGEFLVQIWEETGLSVPLLAAEREAELAFLGVLRGLEQQGPHALAVVDVGGRSTEIVIGDASGEILWKGSFPLGAVRLTEACVTTDPIAPQELDAMRKKAQAVLVQAEEAWKALGQRPEPLGVAAVGGTATTLAAIGLGLETYDPSAVHQSAWKLDDVTELIQRLAAMPLKERRRVTGLQPERADVIVAGLVILEQSLFALQRQSFWVSETDLLQGLLWSRLG